MGLKSIASRTEEVVPIFAIPKLIMEPVKKRGCKGGEVGNLSPLTVGGGGNRKHFRTKTFCPASLHPSFPPPPPSRRPKIPNTL